MSQILNRETCRESIGIKNPDELEVALPSIMEQIIMDKEVDVTKGIIHHKEGLDLMPCNIDLSGVDVSLVNAMSREFVLKTYVESMREFYDYILIDCMPSLGMITVNSLTASDSVLIPVQAAYLPVKELEQLIMRIIHSKSLFYWLILKVFDIQMVNSLFVYETVG